MLKYKTKAQFDAIKKLFEGSGLTKKLDLSKVTRTHIEYIFSGTNEIVFGMQQSNLTGLCSIYWISAFSEMSQEEIINLLPPDARRLILFNLDLFI